MINFSDKTFKGNQNTYFISNNFFFQIRVYYEIMRKNTVEAGKPEMIIWRIRNLRCIPKATSTRSEFVMHIAFALQQWLLERASVDKLTFIACLLMYG